MLIPLKNRDTLIEQSVLLIEQSSKVKYSNKAVTKKVVYKSQLKESSASQPDHLFSDCI